MSKQKKSARMPTVWELLMNRSKPTLFPQINSGTKDGKREYQRRYMKIRRDRTRQRSYNPRPDQRKKRK